ncbi:12666_t:CDS:1, partial [Racocetra persica]
MSTTKYEEHHILCYLARRIREIKKGDNGKFIIKLRSTITLKNLS